MRLKELFTGEVARINMFLITIRLRNWHPIQKIWWFPKGKCSAALFSMYAPWVPCVIWGNKAILTFFWSLNIMTRLVPVLMIFKVVRAKVTQKVKGWDGGTVEPRNNGPKSSGKSHKSRFSLIPFFHSIPFHSFPLLFIFTITDFGNKEQLCLVPSNPLFQGFTVSGNWDAIPWSEF